MALLTFKCHNDLQAKNVILSHFAVPDSALAFVGPKAETVSSMFYSSLEKQEIRIFFWGGEPDTSGSLKF